MKPMPKIMKYLRLILTITCFTFAGDNPYVIMISFDGFRYDYPEKVNSPNLDYIRDNGIKAESLIPVFPSLTFPNHYSIATGCYSETHKITGNNFYSKEFGTKYSYRNSNTVQNEKFYDCEPIWVTAERQNIKTATFFWVGSEARIKGYYPSIYKNYTTGVGFKTRIDSAMAWLELPETIRPHLIMLYFSEPDHTAHEKGPENDSTLNKAEYMDSILGYLLDRIKQKDIKDKINLIVVSDHGMASINKKNQIILDDYVTDLKSWFINGQGPIVHLDRKRKWDKTLLNKMRTEIRSIPHVKVYEKENLPERLHFNNINTGEIVIIADEGYMIATKWSLKNTIFSLKGMHGFDPSSKLMHGIFYAIGPDFKNGYNINSFENIHIYPLVCNLLGIDQYFGTPDTPEGNISVLKEILN